jgi:hypothetical protein
MIYIGVVLAIIAFHAGRLQYPIYRRILDCLIHALLPTHNAIHKLRTWIPDYTTAVCSDSGNKKLTDLL